MSKVILPPPLGAADCQRENGTPAGMARNTDPATSHQAAASCVALAETNRAAALAALRAAGPSGLNDFELADITGVQQNSIGKRRLELERAGYVEFTGETRPSTTGRASRVYRAVVQLTPSN